MSWLIISIEPDYEEFLNEIEISWLNQVKSKYPLFRDISVYWNVQKKMDYLWASSFVGDVITVDVSTSGKDLHKKLNKLNKNYKLSEQELLKSFYYFELYKNFYKKLEVPFSPKDRKFLHKAIYQGLVQNDPELLPTQALSKIEILSEVIKEFIALNRMYVENTDEEFFINEIINFQYNILLEKSFQALNIFTVVWYLNTVLYSSKPALQLLEKKLLDDVYGVTELALKKLLNRKLNIELPSKLNNYLDNDEKELRDIQKLTFEIRKLFERTTDRYTSVTRLVTVLDKYLDFSLIYYPYKPAYSKDELLIDLMDTFTIDEQSQFVKGILNQANVSEVVGTTTAGISFEQKAMHEFYRRNHPSLHLLGDNGVSKNILQKGNYRVKIKKVNRISEHDIENKLDLGRILAFQSTFGVPVLVPIDDEDYFYYEYKILYHDKRKIRYRRFSKFFTIPDILEIYIDNTGSMYWQEDENYIGFNDGSRRDMSLSVIYAFIDELYKECTKQHKKVFLRFHSFSEQQVSSDLVLIDDFMNGNVSTLKSLFNPDNGHHFENLDVEIPENDNQKRVIIVITDGDLVLEGRTEREASKLALLAKNPLTQVILFEMEQHFSLGKAVQNNRKIHSYSVKDKDQMFYQGIDVILENVSKSSF